MTQRAFVGLGSNLGDRAANLARAREALRETGRIVQSSSVYRTVPWGRSGQPEFLNAIVEIETGLSPRELLDVLHAIERRIGRTDGERWGPRLIDLDLLLYDDLNIAEDGLRIPHEYLAERAFVLVPLAELDARFAALRDALDPTELAGVVLASRESEGLMSRKGATSVGARVRALATLLRESDALRLRIQRGDEEIELVARQWRPGERSLSPDGVVGEPPPFRVDAIKADLVGIFHLGRPAPVEGEMVDSDRELGYIEALGIRTPIHSMGAGRLVSVAAPDDSPVEYGQTLFSIARA